MIGSEDILNRARTTFDDGPLDDTRLANRSGLSAGTDQ